MSTRLNHRGFTLVEVIIVMVILSIAAVAIGKIVGGIFTGRTSVNEAQVRTQMVTECLEQVITVKRQDGFDELTNGARFGSNNCDSLSAQTGANPPSVSSVTYTGSACPTGAICRVVTINAGPSVNLMVVNY
jgi:prepilin-type N-terminal cleavage/methylation domain-containing protein